MDDSNQIGRRIQTLSGHLSPNPTFSQYSAVPEKKDSICPVTGYDLNKVSPRLLDKTPIRVCVTGAAGNIAYSLIFRIANGDMFGPNQPVMLRLLDIGPMEQALQGVVMELQDCAFPLVKEIVATVDAKVAFMHCDVAILVGAFPRKKGMERKDLLKKNAEIFRYQGKAINDYASRNIKVVVVGNPANTNCLITMRYAPDIPKENFSALTRLDHNRAKSTIATKLNVPVENVHNVVIWGNHSSTQYPDVSVGFVDHVPSQGLKSNIRAAINDDAWIEGDFINDVQQRGAAIIKARGTSSAASAANAILDHVRDWFFGTKEGELVSMAVVSDGSYGIPKDIVFSFPVICKRGEYSIVKGLEWTLFSKSRIDVTTNELLEERKEAFAFLGEKK